MKMVGEGVEKGMKMVGKTKSGDRTGGYRVVVRVSRVTYSPPGTIGQMPRPLRP